MIKTIAGVALVAIAAVLLVGLFFDTDRMVGRDFETGLANLKAVAERS